MIKKTIKYVDYDGNDREEDFWFNLSKAEVAEMEASATGGLDKMINRIIAERDNRRIIDLFKDLILRSYGKKSDDGRRFIKNDELREDFKQTEAFSELFMELASDSDAAAEFVNGILPTIPDQSKKVVPANK